ncbi:LCL3 [Sanghuangporus sanghuang]
MLEWLFGSSPSPKNTKTPKEEAKSKLEEWLAIYEGQPVKYRLPCTLAAGSVVMLAFQIIYRIHLRRYPTHEWITPDLYAKKLWIKGIVTSVGDGDGFRLFHTPCCVKHWQECIQSGKVLTDETIHVRLAGVDAPELGHFGKKAQPYSSEALNWLQKMVLGKVVYCQLLKRDHYGRAVCAVMLPNGFLSRFSTRRWGLPLADEMLRVGLATVYTNKDAVYGPGGLEGHQVIEAKAKKRRKGRWVDGPDIESPSEWKRRYRLSASPEELLDPVIESERAEQIEKVNGSGKNGKSRRK